MKLSCSVRTRDRNFTSLCQFVTDTILIGVESLLILKGDEPAASAAGTGGGGGAASAAKEEEEDDNKDGRRQEARVLQKKSSSSGLKPTSILSILNDKKYNKSIHLNLSVPNKIYDKSLLEKKIEAKPYSLVTQLIASLSDLGEIVDIAKSFKIKVVACVMVPSDKNKRSADIIGLDWKEYEKNPIDFIKDVCTLADEVLISSPNSFKEGVDLLRSLDNR